jgi:hypothetical protein
MLIGESRCVQRSQFGDRNCCGILPDAGFSNIPIACGDAARKTFAHQPGQVPEWNLGGTTVQIRVVIVSNVRLHREGLAAYISLIAYGAPLVVSGVRTPYFTLQSAIGDDYGESTRYCTARGSRRSLREG